MSSYQAGLIAPRSMEKYSKCVEYTIDLVIPTKLGLVSVRELLDCEKIHWYGRSEKFDTLRKFFVFCYQFRTKLNDLNLFDKEVKQIPYNYWPNYSIVCFCTIFVRLSNT